MNLFNKNLDSKTKKAIKIKTFNQARKNSTDDEIIEILEENNVRIEVIIENNQIDYIYDCNNFNFHLYNEFEYLLSINISEKGLYEFTTSNKIKGDGLCEFHCMNVITKNTLNRQGFDILNVLKSKQSFVKCVSDGKWENESPTAARSVKPY
uniref:Uncharacterized protein n=1 Tax=Strongyloides stercoralis TaxID=6248 RepID=A0AAF5DL98_STRER